MESSGTELEEKTKHRLKVFSQFVRDESPPQDPVLPPNLLPANSEIKPLTTPLSDKSSEVECKTAGPEEIGKMDEEDKSEKRKLSKLCIKPSNTLKISAISSEQLHWLQQKIVQFGSVESMDMQQISTGYVNFEKATKMSRILTVSFFDIESAKKAFRGLLELRTSNQSQNLSVSYVYGQEKTGGATYLPSIHESSDSNKSEENSDSEHKMNKVAKAKECGDNNNIPAWIPHASLPRIPASGDMFNRTTPLPHHFRLSSYESNPMFNSTMHLGRPLTNTLDRGHKYSESSLDVDEATMNEGIKISWPRNVTPRLLPPPQCYVPQSSAIIPTESTNFVDSDEALSSGRVDFPADLSVPDPGYSSNPQLLRTQPVKKIETPAPMHTHTRSYDMMYMNPPLYIMQGAYPQYYPPQTQTYYEQSAMVPMEEESYYMPTPAYMPWMEKKGGRRRNPEKEEEKAKFTISLESILEGRDTRTTLMIKNIPNKYNQRMLLSEIDERHKFQYDFFYLPIDFINNCNVGYAFINFVSPLYILRFYEEFNGRKWDKFNSEKATTSFN